MSLAGQRLCWASAMDTVQCVMANDKGAVDDGGYERYGES